MSERKLSKEEGQKQFEEIKRQWLEEAEPYLNHEIYPSNPRQLDGPNSLALAKIEKKYKKKMEELRNEIQEETDSD